MRQRQVLPPRFIGSVRKFLRKEGAPKDISDEFVVGFSAGCIEEFNEHAMIREKQREYWSSAVLQLTTRDRQDERGKDFGLGRKSGHFWFHEGEPGPDAVSLLEEGLCLHQDSEGSGKEFLEQFAECFRDSNPQEFWPEPNPSGEFIEGFVFGVKELVGWYLDDARQSAERWVFSDFSPTAGDMSWVITDWSGCFDDFRFFVEQLSHLKELEDTKDWTPGKFWAEVHGKGEEEFYPNAIFVDAFGFAAGQELEVLDELEAV